MKKFVAFLCLLPLILSAFCGCSFKEENVPEDYVILEQEGKEFKILNLSDVQLTSLEWEQDNETCQIAKETIKALIEEHNPDLITLTGDLSYPNQTLAYTSLRDYLDSFEIPWAPVWGNHDNEGGQEAIDKAAAIFAESKYCLYSRGPENLGNGNYVVLVKHGNKITQGLFFMDTHNCTYRVNILGNTVLDTYENLTADQLSWYSDQVEILKDLGCKQSSMFMHIPFYAYKKAFLAADEDPANDYEVPRDESHEDIHWREGFESAFGLRNDGWGIPTKDDGNFEYIRDLGHTKNVFCGHDHKNNFSIEYEGIRLTYCTKTGPGCYWASYMNGGTLITIQNKGITNIEHFYIDDYLNHEAQHIWNDPIYP